MARKARSYVYAYAELECEARLSGEFQDINHDMIEKNAKLYKTNRSCLDLHSKFLSDLEKVNL